MRLMITMANDLYGKRICMAMDLYGNGFVWQKIYLSLHVIAVGGQGGGRAGGGVAGGAAAAAAG